MKRFIFMACSAALFLVGCEKDDESNTPTPSPPSVTVAHSYVNSEEGSSFTLTLPDGSIENLSGSTIIGWDTGSLLNLNYFKQLRISSGGRTFYLRYNLVNGSTWRDEVEQTHSLYNTPFLLQFSSDMSDTVVEWYCPSCQDINGNASGTVTLLLDVNTPLGVYDMVGEVDATFTQGWDQYHVTGKFWAQNLD
ncbi:MAG: hypothetical protein ACFCUH_09435 [Flavobacteriales bacterium]